jgi:hypothetical protein
MKKIIIILMCIAFIGTSQNQQPVTVWVLYPCTCPVAMLQAYEAPYSDVTFDINEAMQFETQRGALTYMRMMIDKGTTEYWGAKPVRK